MNNFKLCPCNSGNNIEECCLPYIKAEEVVPTAEKLMRSRFTAYSLHNSDYLYNTTHVSQRKYITKQDILAWAKENTWQTLEILNSSGNFVEFKAFYLDKYKKPQVHHEKSTFILFQSNWYYVDGEFE